jgi:hemoglobin/transferrin/lactoferrin receptor protein
MFLGTTFLFLLITHPGISLADNKETLLEQQELDSNKRPYGSQVEHIFVIGDRFKERGPNNYSLFERDFIIENSQGRREDIFRYTPGIQVLNERGINGRVIIRGLANRQLELVDGARNRFFAGHVYNSFLDPLFTQAIKLNSGATASSSGSGAIGGQLLQETVNPTKMLRGDQSRGLVQLQSGNNMAYGAGAVQSLQLTESLDLALGLVSRKWEDRKLSDHTRIPYSALETQSGFLKLNYMTDGLTVTPSLIYRRDDSLVPLNPESEGLNIPEIMLTELEREHLLVANNMNLSLGRHDLDWHISLQSQEVRKNRFAMEQIDDRRVDTFQSNISDTIYWTDIYDLQASTYHQLEFFENRVLGLRNGSDPIPSFPRGRETEISHHHRLQIQSDHLLIYAGGRSYEFSGLVDQGNSTQRYRDFLPEAGLTYSPLQELQVGLFYAKAYQPPSLPQLYPEGMHFPGNFYLPSDNLRPESSENIELNIRGLWNRWDWSISVYRNRATDFINQEITMTTTQFLNIESVTSQGVEGQINWRDDHWLTGLNFDFHKHIDGRDGLFLLNQGPNTINAFVDYRPSRCWNFAIYARHLLPQMRVTEGLPTPGRYTIWDTRLGRRVSLLGQSGHINLIINNLMNRQFFLPGSTFPGQGTEFFINLNMEI